MKSRTRHTRGARLEDYVALKFQEVYKYCRPTIASGATPVEKGDVKTPWFLCECKGWNTKSLSIKNDVWEKIEYEAARESKDPVYFIENSTGNRLAAMAIDDWFNLIYELMELREKTNG
jgi:hypothetical protein